MCGEQKKVAYFKCGSVECLPEEDVAVVAPVDADASRFPRVVFSG